MKAIAVFPGQANSVHLADLPKPSVHEVPNGRGVLVKVLRVGVDGTDKEINAAEYGAPPHGHDFLVIGHESFGRVEAIGPNVTEFQPGDYVVATVRRPGTSLYDQIGTYDMTTDDTYFERGINARFWNRDGEYLYDVADPDHQAGTVDTTFRPNQILAVGGLPVCLLNPDQARSVVEAVEARLWTPLGLRSLAPEEPAYVPRYQGGVRERDGAYHQGSVWPWLIGPFVEAWVRVHGGTPEAKRDARTGFLEPLLRHLDEAGLGHMSEIADGDPPHTPRGCPFQAWSLGEVLRLSMRSIW